MLDHTRSSLRLLMVVMRCPSISTDISMEATRFNPLLVHHVHSPASLLNVSCHLTDKVEYLSLTFYSFCTGLTYYTLIVYF